MNFSKLLQWSMLLAMAKAAALPSVVSNSEVPAATTVATNYRITVINNSGLDNNYGIFLEPPIVTNVPSDNIWTNTWVVGKAVNGGNFNINVNDTFYTWIGQAPQSPVPGVIIQGGVGRAVPQLGADGINGTTFGMGNAGGTPKFISPNPPAAAPPGSFQVITDSTFDPNDLFLLGLGAVNPNSGVISPAAVISAVPNQRYSLFPVVKYYVSTGVFLPGEIVNIDRSSEMVGLVDFSSGPGLGKFGCNLVQMQNGLFVATYTSF